VGARKKENSVRLLFSLLLLPPCRTHLSYQSYDHDLFLLHTDSRSTVSIMPPPPPFYRQAPPRSPFPQPRHPSQQPSQLAQQGETPYEHIKRLTDRYRTIVNGDPSHTLEELDLIGRRRVELLSNVYVNIGTGDVTWPQALIFALRGLIGNPKDVSFFSFLPWQPVIDRSAHFDHVPSTIYNALSIATSMHST